MRLTGLTFEKKDVLAALRTAIEEGSGYELSAGEVEAVFENLVAELPGFEDIIEDGTDAETAADEELTEVDEEELE